MQSIKIDSTGRTNRFWNEEVRSNYGYPSSYTKPKSIAEQCSILCKIFPGVGFSDEKLAEREVPEHAEGWFAIPRWQRIAPTRAEATQKVLDAIKRARKYRFRSRHDERITNEHLRQSAKTEAAFQELGEEQKDHDVLVVAAQFGLRHRGRSVRRALEVMQPNECGLDTFALGIMLLTHPECLSQDWCLWITCAGNEPYGSVLHPDSLYVPQFVCGSHGQVVFGSISVATAFELLGPASAFVSPP